MYFLDTPCWQLFNVYDFGNEQVLGNSNKFATYRIRSLYHAVFACFDRQDYRLFGLSSSHCCALVSSFRVLTRSHMTPRARMVSVMSEYRAYGGPAYIIT